MMRTWECHLIGSPHVSDDDETQVPTAASFCSVQTEQEVREEDCMGDDAGDDEVLDPTWNEGRATDFHSSVEEAVVRLSQQLSKRGSRGQNADQPPPREFACYWPPPPGTKHPKGSFNEFPGMAFSVERTVRASFGFVPNFGVSGTRTRTRTFSKKFGLFVDFFTLSEGLHSSQSASVLLLALRAHHSHAY